MSEATMTTKGQLTVPVDVRQDLGLRAGTKVAFVKVGPGVYELTATHRSIRDLYGILKYDGPPVSIEQMNEAIAEGAAETMRG